MLAWHNIWMASHGRELAAEARKLGQEVRGGARSLFALAIVVAVAVMREGSEVALFLYGLVAAGGTTARDLLVGSALGLAAGVAVSAVTYFGLVTIPPRRLFAVTTGLITFLAAGLAAQAANFLQQAGLAPVMSDTAWDTSAILSDTSLFGRVLHTLIGYSDQPSVLQVVVYAVDAGGDFCADQGLRAARRRAPAADAAGAERVEACATAAGAAGFPAPTRRNSDGQSRSPARRRLRALLPGAAAAAARARRRSGPNPARRRARRADEADRADRGADPVLYRRRGRHRADARQGSAKRFGPSSTPKS